MKLVYFLITLVLISISITQNITTDDDETGKRLINNEMRRRLIFDPVTAWNIIGGIAAIVGTGAGIAGLVSKEAEINDWGASFQIDNYFESVDAHLVGTVYVGEGESKQAAATIIRAKEKESGGVYSDIYGSSDGSAGLLQYIVKDPVTGSPYCFEYLWINDAEQDKYEFGHDINMHLIAARIYLTDCMRDKDAVMNDIIVILIRPAVNHVAHTYYNNAGGLLPDPLGGPPHAGQPRDFAGQAADDLNFVGKDARSALITYGVLGFNAASSREMRIHSADLKVAMRIRVAGKKEKPHFDIEIGPYAKIFGISTPEKWDIIKPLGACNPGFIDTIPGTGIIGIKHWDQKFRTMNECREACIKYKGSQCNFFIYAYNLQTGNQGCYYIEDPTKCKNEAFGTNAVVNVIAIQRKTDKYELLANDRSCDKTQPANGLAPKTVDECYDICKRLAGDRCKYLIYNYVVGHCYYHDGTGCSRGEMKYAPGWNQYRVLQ